MASSTRRLRSKNLLNTTKRIVAQGKPKTRKRSDARNENVVPPSCSSVPLLDMLAEVASATLKNDPTLRGSRSSYSKMLEKSPKSNGKPIHQSEVLTLDQIRVLSDRMLLEMFSELTSDEIKRHYSYKCFLVPEKCSETFKSFGNETKARLQMKSHLLTHIAELLAEANGPGKPHRHKFTAEPLSARKKRLQEGSMKKRRKMYPVKSQTLPKKILRTKEVTKKQINADLKCLRKATERQKSILHRNETSYYSKVSVSISESNTAGNSSDDEGDSDQSDEEASVKSVPHTQQRHLRKGRTRIKEKPTTQVKNESKSFEDNCFVREQVHNGWNIKKEFDGHSVKTLTSCVLNNEPACISITEEQLLQHVVDTLDQPQHDHCYTSIMGKKKGVDLLHLEYSVSSDEESNDVSTDAGKKRFGFMYDSPQLIVATPTFPFIYVPLLPNIAHIMEIDNVKSTLFRKSSSSDTVSSESSRSPLTGDSKDSDSGSDNSLSNSKQCFVKRSKKASESTELERKSALKYIRCLRTKKKEERGPLVCRICKNKTFTAQATLMYHYRSHAGIKPFICTICGATFTRQHSLNYHMLIHNNKSRFVCGHCGRTFRHPSHYKEHLRRHTGETPYECGDCGLRFKTRNTYKRHLKTRHGKILTAQGIITLSLEEFYKVRTNPRKKLLKIPSTTCRKKDQETQWPEDFGTSLLDT